MTSFTRVLPSLSHATRSSPTLLRPLATSSSTSSTSSRLFTTSARTAFSPSLAQQRPQTWTKAREAFKAGGNASGKRGIATVQQPAYGGGKQQVEWRKIGINVGVGAVGAVALNLLLNQPEGTLASFEGDYLRKTFGWTAGGLTITAAAAYLAHQNGLAVRLMSANPWAVMAGGAALSIGSMMGVYYTAPDSPLHYASWAAFSTMQGLTLSPVFFLAPAILGRAGLYTLGAVGGISYVGATAESEKYLWIGGPLLAGLGVLVCANLAPMLMPRMALRTMTNLERVGAYGGVAVFSGMILYDTQKIRRNAHLAQRGVIRADPIRESVSMILDVINLFTSIVRILLLQQGNRRK
ncbi:hypothetical protein JCM11641_004314 [Rhodosporidiobolus odoratus]